jgi:beta-1,4-N-acetylglucosaminyltransferase
MAKVVFATVGTTQFDGLVDALLSDEVLVLLAEHGYTELRLQVGHGTEPSIPASPPLKVKWYRFKDGLSADMAESALLISHAGAGSILEGLRLGKLLLVVVNDQLMHNHQQELAHALAEQRHLVATTPGLLRDELQRLLERPPALLPYPEADPTLFPRFLTGVLGLV